MPLRVLLLPPMPRRRREGDGQLPGTVKHHTAGDAAVAATVGVGSERGLSKEQEANGESYAEK